VPELKLEIVCANIESVIAACNGGADRIELCDNLSEGGVTPSFVMIKLTKEKFSGPLHVMIRPRGGNFIYSDDEFEIMKHDIGVCKHLKVEGIVLGILNASGRVDVARTKELVELAKPLSVTFHRAFDATNDPFTALQDILDCGCRHILTSGQQPTAMEGSELISELIKRADSRIIIMPGGGVRSANIQDLVKTGAHELHSSALSGNQKVAEELEIQKMKSLLGE